MIFHLQVDLENQPLDTLAVGRMLMELAGEIAAYPERGEYIVLNADGTAAGIASFIREGTWPRKLKASRSS